MVSPVIASLASIVRIDFPPVQSADPATWLPAQLERRERIAQCLAASLDGEDVHRDPRSDAGKFTTEHRVNLKWRAQLFGDRNAQFLLFRNLQLEGLGAFERPLTDGTRP